MAPPDNPVAPPDGRVAPPEGQERQGTGARPDSAMRSLVRVESALQLGLVLPIAVLLGWLAGAALDRWLHVHWLSVAGLILGAVAGFIEVFRFVAAQGRR